VNSEFAVPPPDLRKASVLVAPALLAAVVGMTLAARARPSALLLVLPVIMFAFALMALTLRRRRVRLQDGELVVHAGLHSCRVPIASLDLAQARIVDLNEHTALKPMLKTFGASLPGYRAGHFRLRDRGRAFVLLTGARRVLVLPELSGRRLLLGVEKPQALLDALTAARQR
jgi:hypothetical protein